MARSVALLGALTLALVAPVPGLVRPMATGTLSSIDGQDSFVPTAAAATPTTLTLLPKTAANTVGTQHCVTATVRDEVQNPSPGVSVVFSVGGANSAGGARVTNANGQASFCYTGTRAGSDVIDAFADTDGSGTQNGAEPSDGATKTWRAAAPATLTLLPATATSPPQTEHCLTATVRDSFGNPAGNVTVRFSVTGAHTTSGQRATGSAGRASFCYTGTRAGTDTIRAFADTDGSGAQNGTEPGDNATKIWKAGPPATLALAPATATGPAGSEHCLTGTVRDSLGNPNPDMSTRFSVSGANTAGGQRTTTANGQASFCYTGTHAGGDTINAFADTDGSGGQNGSEPSDSATKTYVAAAPATLTLTPATASNIAGTEHCLTATVRDAFANPNSGMTVRFSVTGANAAGGPRTTGGGGLASFCYTGTKAGTDTIGAFADTDGSGAQNGAEPGDTATKTYTPAASATLALAPQSATSAAGIEHCVTATVRDAFANPTPGVTVRFSVTGANTAGGPRTSGAGGLASFCYTGNSAGSDTIRAFADTDGSGTQNGSEPGDSAAKTYVPAAPATLVLAPATASDVAGTEHCVTATVRDAFANPNPGVTVRFSVTGPNSAGGPRTTGPAGQTIFCYTGTKTGNDTIRAFADTDASGAQNGAEPGDSAAETYTPAAPASLALAPQSATSTAGIQHCVTATVRDSFANATPGITIRLSVTGANAAGGQRITGAAGLASFCYTGTKAGSDTIQAFADTDGSGAQNGAEPGDSAAKTYTPATPSTLALAPQSATNAAGVQHCVTGTVRDAFANPTPGVTVRFSVTGANVAGGPRTTGAGGLTSFCYAGTKAGADTINAFADTDGNGAQNGTEPGASATNNYTAAAPATLVLAPPSATKAAGVQHCVTATVRDAFENPTPGVTVRFSVTGANAAGSPRTTGTGGFASFCYTGTHAGTDAIGAFADTDGSGAQNGNEPGDSATETYVAAAPANLALAPQSATSAAGVQHCVTATVQDAFANPTAGKTVRFSVTGANQAAGTELTDVAGQASLCYAGTKAGADTINAFVDTDGSGVQNGTEPGASVSKTYTPAAPAALALAPKSASNTVGTEHCVTATVKDAFQNPTPGVSVVFTVTGPNSAGGSGQTGPAGQTSYCYTGTKTGTDAINGFADTDGSTTQNGSEPSDGAGNTYTPASPVSLALSPQSATNAAGVQHCVTATVRDAFANPNPAVAVRFSVTGANTAGGQQATGATGRASFCYTGTHAGADTISAFADTDASGAQNGSEPGDSAAKTYVAAAPNTLTLAPAADTSTAGTAHCVTATVRDAFANPARGVTIRFSVTGANTAGGQKITGAGGLASYCYTGTNAGGDTIAAYADTDGSGAQNGSEPGDTATETYGAAAPAALALAPQSSTGGVGEQHCVTATVSDAFGNPVRAVGVRFSVTGANTAGGQKTTSTAGTASFCYTGNKAGADTINAFADTDGSGAQNGSEPGDNAGRTYVAAAPTRLTLAPSSDRGPAGIEHCLTATVRDAFGNLVRQVTVRFAVTGANTAAGEQATGASGQASFCYTGTKAGTDAINAFADTDGSGAQNGSEPGDGATKFYVAAAPATLALSPKSATASAGEQHCVTATVRDAFANRVRSVTVRFSVTGANTTGGQQTTGVNGQAVFCYVGTSAGSDTIAAFADTDDSGAQNGSEPSDSAANTYVAAAPSTLALTPAVHNGPVGTEHCVTARVRDAFGNTVAGVNVRFSVTGANTASGQQTTASAGQAGFCYTGTATGTDTIDAFADTDGSGAQNGNEPADSATNTYVAA